MYTRLAVRRHPDGSTGLSCFSGSNLSYQCVCTIGKAGFAAPGEKREGDNKTPQGVFPLRPGFYRPDKFFTAPVSGVPLAALSEKDGWCDDPVSPAYNTRVIAPFSASHEKLWRDDRIYDIIIPLGYNDSEIIPGAGSAIFFHLSRPDGKGTEGCIAVSRQDMLAILPHVTEETEICIR